jgi:hypothetical protein
MHSKLRSICRVTTHVVSFRVKCPLLTSHFKQNNAETTLPRQNFIQIRSVDLSLLHGGRHGEDNVPISEKLMLRLQKKIRQTEVRTKGKDGKMCVPFATCRQS